MSQVAGERRQAMIVYSHLYVGGSWVRPAGESTLEIASPATEEPIAEIARTVGISRQTIYKVLGR